MRRVAQRSSVYLMGAVVFLLTACADGGAESGDGARAEIAEPTDGSMVSGPEVRVVLRTQGAQVEPADNLQTQGRGHHHVFVDEDLSNPGEPIPAGVVGVIHMGDGSEELVLNLAPGEHRLIAWFAYGDHVPIEEVAADTVTFTVTE